MKYSGDQIVQIIYTDYRSETNERKIVPIKVWFGNNEYHTDDQWILDAYDVAKKAVRSFALKDISSWK